MVASVMSPVSAYSCNFTARNQTRIHEHPRANPCSALMMLRSPVSMDKVVICASLVLATPSQHLLLSFYLLDCLCVAIQVLQKRNCAKQLSAAAAMAFLPDPAARSQEHMVPYVPSRHPQRSQRNEVLA